MVRKIKKFFQRFSFLLPFSRNSLKGDRYCWAILFNGGWVGSYIGRDLSDFLVEYWMEDFPGDPNPITLVRYYEFFYGYKDGI